MELNIYRQKTLLFIGPGVSIQYVDMKKCISEVDYTASLNDVILDFLTDIYFIGEKFIYEYVVGCEPGIVGDNIQKIFLGLHKNHEKKIDKKYFNKKKMNNSFHFIKSRYPNINDNTYSLDLSKKFSDKNMIVLSNLLNHFPYNKWEYIRSRALSNALQVIFNMGFKEVRLIGFMDSKNFQRSNYKHQEEYVKKARLKYKNVISPKDLDRENLKNSFEYQAQILKTIDFIYKKNKKSIFNLCPKNKSPQHIFDYIGS